MSIAGSLSTFFTTRLPMVQSASTDAGLQQWMRQATAAVNAIPPFSTFTYSTPESNVTAAFPTIGVSWAPSSVGSTVWLKKSGSGNTGWVAIA